MAQDPKKADSVFDFLYVDSGRIALFLSQFNQYGHLKSLTKSVSENSSAGGDFNPAKLDYSEGSSTGIKKEYDAQWIAPLSFLDQAQQRNIIERDIASAGIGNLVLASGALSVRDLRLIMGIMALPSMKAMIPKPAQPPDTRGRNQRRYDPRTEPEAAPDPNALGFEVMSVLPHGTQALMVSGGTQIWCSVRDDCLLVPASELFLSHGVDIPGEWNILGILDARPDEEEARLSPQERLDGAGAAMATDGVMTLVTQGFGGFIDGVAPLARMLLGRRSTAYGLTPILIFREVAGGN
jgi:hypothetical protein